MIQNTISFITAVRDIPLGINYSLGTIYYEIFAMPKNRSQRLRKKLYLGEFTELGFKVFFELKTALKEEEIESFLDLFLANAIEKNGLVYGGSFGNSFDGFIVLEKRGSVTEDLRQTVKTWLDSNPEVINVEVGELINAWY